MILFTCVDYDGSSARLNEEESHHCIRVLRHKMGDVIPITDMDGHYAKGVIAEIKKDSVLLYVKDSQYLPPRTFSIEIAIAPTKKSDRIEFFIEKAVEIGVEKIHFFTSERSEKTHINMGRIQKIVLSAAKQSLKYRLPIVENPVPLKALFAKDEWDQKYIAHCMEPDKALTKVYNQSGKAILVIGPEGDFSPSEVALGESFGFIGVNLGENRLRTETAGLVGVTLMNFTQKGHDY